MRRRLALLAAVLLGGVPSAAAQSTLPGPEPTLLARVECRALEGPCDYRYAVVNPGGARERATGFSLLEVGEATVRSSAGWKLREDGGTLRWEAGSDGVSAGWMVGGFYLTSPALPRVSLAEVRAGGVATSAPTLVPGAPAADLGSAEELVRGLLDQLPSLAGMGWIAPGPGRGLLGDRLQAILDLLGRGQRTEAIRRMRSLVAEVGRLSPAASIPIGRAPGRSRPPLTRGAPLAPEVRDLYAATLGLAMARLGALR